MVRVLEVMSGASLGFNGIASMIMSYYRNIDTEKVQFDFATYSSTPERYDDEIIRRGGQIYRLPSRTGDLLNYIKGLRKIIRDNKYKIVHIHHSSASMIIEAFTARISGASVVIGHSHISKTFCVWQHYLLRPFLGFFLTDRFACSVGAGKWLYGAKSFKIINNAVDLNVFHYDEEAKKRLRSELKLNGFTVGFCGRLAPAKNVLRIIDIFAALKKIQPTSHLILIGDGPLRLEAEEKAKGLADIHILGFRSDVPELMSAMDVFLLPSIFEGLPVVLAEAQATGLPCVVSDNYPAIDLIGHNKVLSLESSDEEWADAILHSFNGNREDAGKLVYAGGYDIAEEAKKLQDFYLSKSK